MNTNLDLFKEPPWWEVMERDRILRVLAARRAEWLKVIRQHLRVLYENRLRVLGFQEAYVCADDARNYFEGLPDVPPPNVLNRNFLGATFKTADWEYAGVYLSSTPGSHANRLVKWRLKR